MTSPHPFNHQPVPPGYGPPQWGPSPTRPSTAILGVAMWGSLVLSLINLAFAVISFVNAFQGYSPEHHTLVGVVLALVFLTLGVFASIAGSGRDWARVASAVQLTLVVLAQVVLIAIEPMMGMLVLLPTLLLAAMLAVIWWLPATATAVQVKAARRMPSVPPGWGLPQQPWGPPPRQWGPPGSQQGWPGL